MNKLWAQDRTQLQVSLPKAVLIAIIKVNSIWIKTYQDFYTFLTKILQLVLFMIKKLNKMNLNIFNLLLQ